MKKTVLGIIISCLISPVAIANAQNELQIAIGASNSEVESQFLTSLFGEDSDEVIKIDGTVLNDFLQDGSDKTTGVFSSVSVEFLKNNSGVDVQILTPENITEVQESTYRNAAIAAGAKNVKIQIAAASPVSGHGALAGVYKIFSDAGMELNSENIANAEMLINIEELLSEASNMKDSEISKFIAEFHLGLIDSLEREKELSNSSVSDILKSLLKNYNYDFSE